MAKGNKYGHPGSSGLAQSGGRNTTFGGGKGGTAASRKSTTERKVGSTKLNNGLRANIRTESGDNARVKRTGSIGAPPPLMTHSGTKISKVKVQKPARGGSS